MRLEVVEVMQPPNKSRSRKKKNNAAQWQEYKLTQPDVAGCYHVIKERAPTASGKYTWRVSLAHVNSARVRAPRDREVQLDEVRPIVLALKLGQFEFRHVYVADFAHRSKYRALVLLEKLTCLTTVEPSPEDVYY